MARIDVDFTANAAYLRLHEGTVARTEEVSAGVMVDLDDMGVVLGVEVLDLGVFIPYSDLVHKFHVRTEEVRYLETIRPSVATLVTRIQETRESDHSTAEVPC